MYLRYLHILLIYSLVGRQLIRGFFAKRERVNLLAMHYHWPGSGVRSQPPSNHGSHPTSEFQQRVAERTRV